jgi:uncharacterized protein YjiS (DUF1127 family)
MAFAASTPMIFRPTSAHILRTAFDDAKTAIAQRRVYNTTFGELAVLSNRELADLGICRCDIKRIALEAAYGA